MTGISGDSVAAFQARIRCFNPKYVADWTRWMGTPAARRGFELKRTLGKWQACRGNPIRELAGAPTAAHTAPYIEDLLRAAAPHIAVFGAFDLAHPRPLAPAEKSAINSLWAILEQISYPRTHPPRKRPPPRGGLAGVVGISKAAMLLTHGRLGPAFDSKVRKKMSIRAINTATDWITAIELARTDVQTFCSAHSITLQAASGLTLHTGRIYDMALGP